MNTIQRSNLAKLAKGLMTTPTFTGFDMNDIANHHGRSLKPAEVKNECGTCCCALGHAPIFCNDTRNDEGWEDYCLRVLGVVQSADLWRFLFGADWNNDQVEFAARAFKVLSKDEDGRDEDSEHAAPEPSDFDQWIIP